MSIAGVLGKDIRYAFRQLLRNPLFTVVAIVSIATGIGATTAIFSVFNQAMLQTLPVRDPHQLVALTDPNSGGVATGMFQGDRRLLSYPEFAQLRDHTTSFTGMCALESGASRRQVRIAGGSQETSSSQLVSEDYFSVLGVEAAIGRLFSREDASAPGTDPYAVLSYDYWQRRFGGKTSVLGTTIHLYGATLQVIGVAAPGFQGTSPSQRPDFWIPMMMQPLVMPGRDWLHEDLAQSLEKVMWLHVIGRLKAGVGQAGAQADVDVRFRNILDAGYPANLSPAVRKQALNQRIALHDAATGIFAGRKNFVQQVLILWAASAVVLLISCANVANLLLARATARSREVCVRLSLGASRARLIRQFLTESVVLSLFGGAFGALLAWGGARALVALLSNPQHPLQLAAGLDTRVLLFATLLALVTGLLFGLLPAVRGTRISINEGLRQTSRTATASGGRISAAKLLIAVQVALSVVLVISAGLFMRTVWNLQAVDLGYPKEKLLMLTVDGVTAGYKDVRLGNLWHELAERIRQLPGVRGASYSENGLMGGSESADEIDVEGFTAQRDDEKFSRFDMVGPGYFATVGIPMRLGRDIGMQDTAASPHVCVINEAFARLFFGTRNPIGSHITEKFGNSRNVMEVVGVAANARDHSLTDDVPPRFYIAMDQGMDGPSPWAIFELRTSGDEQQMVQSARKAILGINQDLPIQDVRSLEQSLDRATAQQDTIARLCAIFAGLALLLAACGLYGVLSYTVARRTNEIGIRIALGSGKMRLIAMVLLETGIIMVIGIAAGLVITGLGTRWLASRLYGISAMDLPTIAFTISTLIVVALLAVSLPALRAARVDPIKALRYE